MRHFALSICCGSVLAAFLAVTAPGSEAQTLDDAIRAAHKTHPTVDQAKAALIVARERFQQTKSSYFPRITLEGSASYSDRVAQLQDDTRFEDSSEPLNATLSMEHMLYTHGLRPLNTKRAALDVKAQRYQLQDMKNQLAIETARTMLLAFQADEAYRIEQDTNQRMQAQIDAEEMRHRLGTGTITDIAQVKARYARSSADLARAKYNLDRLVRTFERLTGLPLNSNKRPLNIPAPPTSLEDALRLARRHSPVLKSAKTQYDGSRVNAVAASRTYGPQVGASVEASTSRNTSPTIDRDDDIRATLSLSIPLYTGGRANAETRQAIAESKMALGAIKVADDDLEAQVTDAWINHVSALAETEALLVQVQASEDAVTGLQRGRELGVASVTDVLNAMEQLARARLSLSQAETQALVAQFELSVMTRKF